VAVFFSVVIYVLKRIRTARMDDRLKFSKFGLWSEIASAKAESGLDYRPECSATTFATGEPK